MRQKRRERRKRRKRREVGRAEERAGYVQNRTELPKM